MQSFNWENAPLDRNILLEASAGTGKTYTLERLVMRLVTEREIPLPRILVVTFTNMAAREMQERIGRLLTAELRRSEGDRSELLRRAVREFDRAAIYTIHGFCARVLQTLPFECGLSPGAQAGVEDDITGDLVQDWFRKNETRDDPFLSEGYRAAYRKEKSFAALLKSINRLIESEKTGGQFRLVPGDDLEHLLADLCRNWKSCAPFTCGEVLARECRSAESADGLVSLLKADGLGKRLGAKTAAPFYEALRSLGRLGTFSDFLDFLGNQGKGFFTQLEQARGDEAEGSSPLVRAFIDWSRSLPDILFTEKSASALEKSLALLFEFRCALEVTEERNRARLNTGKLTYNDLIDLVHSLVAGPGRREPLLEALDSRYQVLLVDEFQDTDIRQWDIFSSLFNRPGKNYFLIGDPKQSIYRFRGADLNVYLDVRDSLPRENLFRLDRNFRSHPMLLDGFNRFFSSLFGEEGRPGAVGYSPVGAGKHDVPMLNEESGSPPPIDFLLLRGEPASKEEAEDLWLIAQADHILSLLSDESCLLDDKPVRASHIAVLLENNRQCSKLQELLSDRAVPAVIFQERDIFSSREVSFPLLFLEAMMGRDRGESLKKLLLSSLVGLTAGELVYLEESGYMDSLSLRFRLFREKTDRGDLIGQFYRFCRLGGEIAAYLYDGEAVSRDRATRLGENFLIRLMREPGGERLYTNLRHILEILHSEQMRKRLNAGELHRFCRSELSRSHGDETFQVRLDRDGEAVRIMTLHKSKGLQFPLVFFGGGIYQDIINRAASFLTYRKGGENWCDYLRFGDGPVRARHEAWDEKKRLYYVGLTRAESKLFLPLYEKWDKSWLSWFYHQVSGKDRGDLNPFEKSGIDLPCGTGLDACRSLAEEYEALFRIVPPRSGGSPYVPREKKTPLNKPLLPDLNLTGRYPALISFSSLTENHSSPENLHDENSQVEADYDRSEEEPDERDGEISPLTIPGGTGLGNLVHMLFEEFDYHLADCSLGEFLEREDVDTFVRDRALYYFKTEWYVQYGGTVKEMVWNTLRAPLFPEDPTEEGAALHAIPREKRLHEMEFLLKLKERGKIVLKDFHASCREGYLKGFIDLIFIRGGKFYIADWKTTRCVPGDPDPYDVDSVGRIMDSHRYHLQYWIYTAAFYLFMLRNGSSFDYDRDFGGVFYFFNRAMGPDRPGRGLFFTRPEKGEVERFLHDFTEASDDVL